MKKRNISPAIQIILIFGIISMLGDVIYESARGVNSQYLNLIGISATKVGVVFGIGEFLGYFLRLFEGYLSDYTKKHWLFIFVGYGLLFVIPLIGFSQNWNILIILILLERIGKSLRNPAKDTILSSIAKNEVGLGFAFGLQEALDQVGAFLGPLIFTAVFYFTGKNTINEYQFSYKLLFVPFILLMVFVYIAYRKVNGENIIKEINIKEYRSDNLKSIFWIYTFFAFFASLGFVNFSIIGYHLKAKAIIGDKSIAMIYSFAMIVDAFFALLVGHLYDKLKDKTGLETGGILVLALIPLLTCLLPFLTLSYKIPLIIIGMFIWGMVMGTHETIMKSAIGDLVPFSKRGSGYGVFNTSYGLALFCGSSIMGLLYDKSSITTIIIISLIAELIAFILFIKMKKLIKST